MFEKLKQYPSKKRSLFICFAVLLALILVIGAAFGVYAVRVYYIKANGVELRPSKDYEILDIQYYLQNDPEWSGDLIGNSNSRMGGTGCLITCVASAVTDLGVSVTPKELNIKLADIEGYQGADLIWYKINEAFPEIDYKYSRIFSSATIERDLNKGQLPIINVKYYGRGMTHWLLVVGAEDGEFLVFDPLNQDKEPIKLSTHGKVYAYRVLTRADAP